MDEKNKQTETWIEIEVGDGYRRSMPKKNWHKALETSQWLIETAVKAGRSKEEAEELYSVRIVREYESRKMP